MKLLLTGSTGFLGRIIKETLKDYNITGLARSNSDINTNLATTMPILGKYDLVIHTAGKAHSIPKSEISANEFFLVNVTGTLNLLKALSTYGLPKAFVFVSSVAVYGVEEGMDITEDAELQAVTPYGLSKVQAEGHVKQWGEENNVAVSILRLPLLVGSSPTGNLELMIKAICRGYYFRIGSGNVLKSMVLAEDIAALIPKLVNVTGTYNLTDGGNVSNKDIENHIAAHFNRKIKTIPYLVAYILAKAGDYLSILPINTYNLSKLTSTLTFSTEKARRELNWKPKPVLRGKWL